MSQNEIAELKELYADCKGTCKSVGSLTNFNYGALTVSSLIPFALVGGSVALVGGAVGFLVNDVLGINSPALSIGLISAFAGGEIISPIAANIIAKKSKGKFGIIYTVKEFMSDLKMQTKMLQKLLNNESSIEKSNSHDCAMAKVKKVLIYDKMLESCEKCLNRLSTFPFRSDRFSKKLESVKQDMENKYSLLKNYYQDSVKDLQTYANIQKLDCDYKKSLKSEFANSDYQSTESKTHVASIPNKAINYMSSHAPSKYDDNDHEPAGK
jgi:hypothetical protein